MCFVLKPNCKNIMQNIRKNLTIFTSLVCMHVYTELLDWATSSEWAAIRSSTLLNF